jgi:hypothetical protein
VVLPEEQKAEQFLVQVESVKRQWKSARGSQVWTCVGGLDVQGRFGRAGEVWTYRGGLRLQVRFAPTGEVWTCRRGLDARARSGLAYRISRPVMWLAIALLSEVNCRAEGFARGPRIAHSPGLCGSFPGLCRPCRCSRQARGEGTRY